MFVPNGCNLNAVTFIGVLIKEYLLKIYHKSNKPQKNISLSRISIEYLWQTQEKKSLNFFFKKQEKKLASRHSTGLY